MAVFTLSSTAICLVVRELRAARASAEASAAAAQEASQSLNAVLESTQDAVVSFDKHLRCLYVNENAATLVGRPRSELAGRPLREIFAWFGDRETQESLLDAARDGVPFRLERRLETSGVWLECNIYPAGNGINLFLRDITANKSAEASRAELAAAIETENRKLATVLQDMPIAVLVVSRELTVEISNPRADALFGRSIHPGDNFRDIATAGSLRTAGGERLPPGQGPLLRTLRDGQSVLNLEVDYFRPDGSALTLIANCIPLRDAAGATRAVLATYSDVTSLRTAQAALAASEHRLRQLFRSPSMGIFSGEGETITDANPAFLNMLGFSAEEFGAGGIRWPELTPPEFAARDTRAISQLMERGFCDPYEKEFFARGGGRVPVLIGVVSASAGSWTPWVVWALDLSDRRRLEERLRQAARLESVGLLAGGVAHDFNNLLTGILGNSILAADQLEPGSATRQLLDHSILATERAADLTRQLLAYAGKGNFVIRPVEISTLVRQTLDIVRTSVPAGVQCRLRLTEGLETVQADPTQIQQLVMNLIINAGEAAPAETGWIDIATGKIAIGPEGLPGAQTNADLLPGHYVFIRVQDNGCGMDEATRKRIFDPFFTTKFTGRGLGLAAALGIARSHQGEIAVTSQPAEGSTFLVVLPYLAPGVNEYGDGAVANGSGIHVSHHVQTGSQQAVP
jgi:PAS domain S-box-containing protein